MSVVSRLAVVLIGVSVAGCPPRMYGVTHVALLASMPEVACIGLTLGARGDHGFRALTSPTHRPYAELFRGYSYEVQSVQYDLTVTPEGEGRARFFHHGWAEAPGRLEQLRIIRLQLSITEGLLVEQCDIPELPRDVEEHCKGRDCEKLQASDA